MKLHLGCGQVYLDGYLNIDYPLAEHSVQHKTLADKQANITKLRYAKDSIEEVRLHHVFEHFDRATACALIAVWSSWLKPDGVIRIEVPDYIRTTKSVLSPITSKKIKDVGLRHIFGSQEATWAVHYHGWSADGLRELFRLFGLEVVSVTKNSWKGTYNVQIIGKKTSKITRSASITACKKWLSQFLVDDSKSEKEMLNYWVAKSKKQIDTGWAK